jgi:hypothetical protein
MATEDPICRALNSISWQLKRIADVIEKDNQIPKPSLEKTTAKNTGPYVSSKLQQLIAELDLRNQD